MRASDIKHFGLSSEHRRHQIGVAAQAPQFTGGEGFAVSDESGTGSGPVEPVVVEGHDYSRPVTAGAGCAPLAVMRAEEINQGIGAALRGRVEAGRIALFNRAAPTGLDIGIDQGDEALPSDPRQAAGEGD